MTELSTERMTQVIVFHDKSHKFITDPQAALIFQASAATGSKFITTPNLGMITFSSIAKVVTVEDFYTQYPQYRVEASRDTFKELYGDFNQQIRYPVKDSLELMKKGFIQFKMYGTKEYTIEHELLKALPQKMTYEEAETEFKDFMKKKL